MRNRNPVEDMNGPRHIGACIALVVVLIGFLAYSVHRLWQAEDRQQAIFTQLEELQK